LTGLKRALLGLAVAALVSSAGISALILSSDFSNDELFWAVFVPLVGLSFVGTGLFAWWRRPENRFGALMTATGFAWLVDGLSWADSPWPYLFSQIFGAVYVVLLAHMLLAFPSGRLYGRLAHLSIYAGYAVATLGTIPGLVFTEHAAVWDGDCGPCPSNPILIHANDSLADVFNALNSLAGIALVGVIAYLLARRWLTAAPPLRRAMAPVFGSGGLALTLVVVVLVLDVFDANQTVRDGVWYATVALVATVPYAFLFGLFRSRMFQAGAVGELVRRLGDATRPGALRGYLADALGDPTLQLAFWLPESERYVNAQGVPVDLPGRRSPRRAWTPVEREGRPVAAIVHDASLREERELVNAVAASAALALENERLEVELRAAIAEVRASRARIVQASDAARRRLERNLHDGAQQRLVSMALTLRMARHKIEKDPSGAEGLIQSAEEELGRALEDLRELARGIHPAVLSDHGLDAALQSLTQRATVPVDLLSTPGGRLPPTVEAAAYFVVAEALTNVAKYAHASKATVSVARDNGRAVVEVRDDGIGGADPAAGTGLRGLADRVAALDGRLELQSRPGEGTIVRAEIPCE
jgi:signal transduction histidine kinase